MSAFNIFLSVHIAAGIVCLVTGIFAAFSKKKRGKHTRFGEFYHGAYVVVFLTAVVTSIMHWEESAHLFYIALFSYGLALFGYLARKMQWKRWIVKHIGGMLGSYIGVVTAVLVVNVSRIPVLNELPVLVMWLLPTIIGTPIIAAVSAKYKRKKRVLDPTA